MLREQFEDTAQRVPHTMRRRPARSGQVGWLSDPQYPLAAIGSMSAPMPLFATAKLTGTSRDLIHDPERIAALMGVAARGMT